MSNIRFQANILMAGKLKDGLYAYDPPQFLSRGTSKSMNSTVNPTKKSCCHIHKPADFSVVSSQQNSQVLSNILTMWHNSLGHPATSIVRIIMLSCPNRNKMESPICSACCFGKLQKFAFPLHLMNILLFINSHRLVG